MSRHTIPIGRIFGIPLDVDYSWFLIFALLTWMLALNYYPVELPGYTHGWYWGLGAVTAVLFFASIVVHELAHSWVALRYKIPVSRITLFVFGGVSQIVGEPPSAGSEFLIAVAGPVTSFVLAAAFLLSERLLNGATPALLVARYLALINGMLGAFNLIPGFPMDGGRVLRAVVWAATRDFRRATLIAASAGRFFGFLFIFAGVWLFLKGNTFNGLWIAFIGWFLESAAASQVQQHLVQGLLVGHRVSEAMDHAFARVPGDATLQRLVEEEILAHARRCLLVADDKHILGLLTLHDIKEVPRSSWPTMTAAQAMVPAPELTTTDPQAELSVALEKMGRKGINQMPVMDGQEIVGMLSRADILKYLQVLQQLKA